MTRGKISLGRAWYSRVFPGWAGPEEVDDVAIATLPIGGAGRWNDLQFVQASAVDGKVVNLTAVPENNQWWVPFCAMFHNDPGFTTNGWMALVNRAGKEVAISDTSSLFADTRFGIPRAVIVPEGWKLRANIVEPTTLGKSVTIGCFYVETPIGEYVAPL